MEGIFVFLWWIINFLFKNIDGVWLVSTLFGRITQYIPVVNLPFYYVVGRAIVSFVFWYGVRWQMMGCLLLVVFFSPFFLYLTWKSTFFSLLLPIFYSTKKSRKEKKKRKKQSKIQEDTHEEKPKELSKLMVKDQNDKWKVKRLECTRLEKLMTQFRLIKNPFDENICIWGKEIQI